MKVLARFPKQEQEFAQTGPVSLYTCWVWAANNNKQGDISMIARAQVLVSSVLLSCLGLSLFPFLAHAQEESGTEEAPVVAEPQTDDASGTEEAEGDNAVPAAVICCDDGGGPGGGTGLDFELGVLEPQVPDRYPGSTALGDGYNPVTGEVTFAVTDISIPGNSPIPVELSRWIPSQDLDTGGPTGWQWNLPLIKGNYLDVKPGHNDNGWDWGYNNWHNGENCSGDADSVMDPHDNLIAGNPAAPASAMPRMP